LAVGDHNTNSQYDNFVEAINFPHELLCSRQQHQLQLQQRSGGDEQRKIDKL
jgi:hypothetical protein